MRHLPSPTLKGTGLAAPRIVPAAAVPRATAPRLPRARDLVIPIAIVALAVMLIFEGRRGNANETLPVDMTVLSATDPLGIGATTNAVIDVENSGDTDLRPRFSLSWLPYPYYWHVVSGPPVLAPRQRATYEIDTPDTVAAPRDGETFTIRVNDAASIVYAASATITKEKRDLAIINQKLGMWTQRDQATGLLSPAGWAAYARRGDGDQTYVEQADVFGVSAVRLRVVQDGQPDPGSWSHTGLTQQIAFPDRPFDIRVLSQAPYQTVGEGWPVNAFGIEISDSANGLIWLLFQPTGDGDREYDLPSGHHIKVYDVPIDQWAERTVDLPDIYRRLNWEPSKKVTLKLFAAAASSQAADIQGYISGIGTLTPAQP
jgi:hypothetical protein